MREFTRTSRACTLQDLHPGFKVAILAYAALHTLAGIDDSLVCCETTSIKVQRGLFGSRAETLISVALCTSTWLVWAIWKDEHEQTVRSARLRDIQVMDYEGSQNYQLIEDTGLVIDGVDPIDGQSGSVFIGLGIESAALSFRARLGEMVSKARS
jgi:hypothetical protein